MKVNPMVNYKNIIKETNSQMFNVRDEFKDNTVEQNQQICKNDRLPFSVGMINVTGDLNIGTAIRSACLLGAENFYIFGRKKFDKRSTVGAENYINIVPYTYADPMTADREILETLRNLPHPIIACEHGGVRLGTVDAQNVFLSVKDSHPMFLFGSESHGIPNIILDSLDPTGYPDYEFSRVSIPQVGVMRSFNVAAAMNIIVWDYCKEAYL
jgi:tRNA G18 (ribose-2'-O)-methylase SpoU